MLLWRTRRKENDVKQPNRSQTVNLSLATIVANPGFFTRTRIERNFVLKTRLAALYFMFVDVQAKRTVEARKRPAMRSVTLQHIIKPLWSEKYIFVLLLQLCDISSICQFEVRTFQ